MHYIYYINPHPTITVPPPNQWSTEVVGSGRSAGEEVNPSHRPTSLLNAFRVSLRRLRRLKSNVPLAKQFSGFAPVSSATVRLDWKYRHYKGIQKFGWPVGLTPKRCLYSSSICLCSDYCRPLWRFFFKTDCLFWFADYRVGQKSKPT